MKLLDNQSLDSFHENDLNQIPEVCAGAIYWKTVTSVPWLGSSIVGKIQIMLMMLIYFDLQTETLDYLQV